MNYLLQINPSASHASSYLPVAIQIIFAVGLVVFLMVLTHLLGPKRKQPINYKLLPAVLRRTAMPVSQWLLNIFSLPFYLFVSM